MTNKEKSTQVYTNFILVFPVLIMVFMIICLHFLGIPEQNNAKKELLMNTGFELQEDLTVEEIEVENKGDLPEEILLEEDYGEVYLTRSELISSLIGYLAINPSLMLNKECFSDISSTSNPEHICYAKERWWIQWKDGGQFFPNEQVTNAGWLKMIFNFLEIPLRRTVDLWKIKDVSPDDWYGPYVSTWIYYGIISKEKVEFNPDNKISLLRISKYIARLD